MRTRPKLTVFFIISGGNSIRLKLASEESWRGGQRPGSLPVLASVSETRIDGSQSVRAVSIVVIRETAQEGRKEDIVSGGLKNASKGVVEFVGIAEFPPISIVAKCEPSDSSSPSHPQNCRLLRGNRVDLDVDNVKLVASNASVKQGAVPLREVQTLGVRQVILTVAVDSVESNEAAIAHSSCLT
jgi:hypothetical protein